MVKKHTIDTTEELWNEFLQFKLKRGFKNTDEAIEETIKEAIAKDKTQQDFYLQDSSLKLPEATESQIKKFLREIKTVEMARGKPIIVLEDKKTNAFYSECHVNAETLLKNMDVDAVIDPDHQEEFRANRELQPDNVFFKRMVDHATHGRQFSDIVIEYADYEPTEKPLKVLGGQHRCEAIKLSKQNRIHGIRTYFDLTKEKRVELYKASNSNIQVPPDLLDRLDETSLEPPNRLRDWCYKTGIMKKGEKAGETDDFSERRISEENATPTVRMMRTFIINFYEGKNYKGNIDLDAHVPRLAETGGKDDERYKELYKKYEFEGELDLVDAGENFAKLHKKQFNTIQKMEIASKKEFRMKAYNLALISAWGFAAGALQKQENRLKKLYQLPNLSGDDDPLNAKAMQGARHPMVDKNTNYRGLGTRTDDKERGRLLSLFLNYSTSAKPKITLEMCNAAILDFHSNDSKKQSDEMKKRAF